MNRSRIVALSVGAVVAAGGLAAVVGPAFGAAGSTTTTSSSTTTFTSSTGTTTNASPSKSCNKPYPPATPTLTLTDNAPAKGVPSGTRVTFSGSLTSNGCSLNNEQVTLYQQIGNNQPVVVGSGKTDKSGAYSITYAPTVTASYYAYFNGDSNGGYLPAQSSSVTVRVK
jgi:hypothetical protein